MTDQPKIKQSIPHLPLDIVVQKMKSSKANIFEIAQRDRTLHHHNLIQPTSAQELHHLSRCDGYLTSIGEEQRRISSYLSLLTLPESEEGRDETFSSADLSQFSLDIDETSTQSSGISNPKSAISLDAEEEDASSEVSPTTTLFVPGQDQTIELSRRSSGHTTRPLDPTLSSYCQPCELEPHSSSHRFVICADTQFGITKFLQIHGCPKHLNFLCLLSTKRNQTWQAEMDYSREAVELINSMRPRLLFVCVCGDLVYMEYTLEKSKGNKSKFPSSLFNCATGFASGAICDSIQDEQNFAFEAIWSGLHPEIGLVCLCGNHDVGNRPTPRSISRFRKAFGDEYLAFWANGTYNIILNNVLFVDPSGARKIFTQQLRWLEERLRYARSHQAIHIFVFAHHPWFLYDKNKCPEMLTGASPYPEEWLSDSDEEFGSSFPDSYFSMPTVYRSQALQLFQRYGVSACFSGHFHQNLVSRTSWGMEMVITAPLSLVFETTGKQDRMDRDSCQGRRHRKMTFESEEAMLQSTDNCRECSCRDCIVENSEEKSCRGVRVVDSKSDGRFEHFFVPLHK
ncbi:hypothetical protein ACHAWF_018483 [Thalassiosira exigua]